MNLFSLMFFVVSSLAFFVWSTIYTSIFLQMKQLRSNVPTLVFLGIIEIFELSADGQVLRGYCRY